MSEKEVCSEQLDCNALKQDSLPYCNSKLRPGRQPQKGGAGLFF
jgi:hypothetical protein